MLSVTNKHTRLSVIVLSVVMLNIVMLCVVAPFLVALLVEWDKVQHKLGRHHTIFLKPNMCSILNPPMSGSDLTLIGCNPAYKY